MAAQSPKILDFQVTTVYNGDLAPWALKGTAGSGELVAHTHAIGDVINLSLALGGKSNVGHTHVASDITDFDHDHIIGDVDGLQDALDAIEGVDCGPCLDRILTNNDSVLIGGGNVLYGPV